MSAAKVIIIIHDDKAVVSLCIGTNGLALGKEADFEALNFLPTPNLMKDKA